MALSESNGRARPDASGFDELLHDVVTVDQRDTETLLWELLVLLDEARTASAQLHRTCGDLRRELDTHRVTLGVSL